MGRQPNGSTRYDSQRNDKRYARRETPHGDHMSAASPSWTVDAHEIDLGPVGISVATNAGPRILSYTVPGGPEFFASLPDSGIELPEAKFFRFLGGHRLWRSPEVPSITYQPDDFDVTLKEAIDGVDLIGQPDGDGVIRQISVRQEGVYTVVRHQLVNNGRQVVRTAPWAITQMTLGGTAVLPQTRAPVDEDGVLPNRSLILWPYTDLGAPEFSFGGSGIIVAGSENPVKAKIGQPNRRGWMAYILGTHIFIKWSKVHDDNAAYPDLGASSQCYRDDRFLELESVGPVAALHPGQQTTLTEIWRIIGVDGRPLDSILDALPEKPDRRAR